MSPRKRVLLLVLIMAVIVVVVATVTITALYRTAMAEERARLTEAAKSQARLIEAVARFDQIYSKDYPSGARQATLDQIKDAHRRYRGFGDTGEFTLSTRQGDRIIFILNHRHYDLDNPKPVPWDSDLAAPMRLALAGKSGTIVGLDYRGETVLAAHEPVGELDLGIVCKIDMAELRAPFIKAGLLSALIGFAAIGLGVAMFFRITNPILHGLQKTVRDLEKALKEVKTLRGILPICVYCNKIKDDQGYWDKVDVYVSQHTEADFSHGICPDCMRKEFPELSDTDPTKP